MLHSAAGSYALRVVGLEPDAEQQTADLCGRVAEGACFAGPEPRQALLGSRVAEQVHISPGQRVKVVLPYEELGKIEQAVRQVSVRGVMRGGGSFRADYDMYVPIGLLHDSLPVVDEATSVSVLVDDADRAGEYAEQISQARPELRAEPWWRANTFVANAIRGNRKLLVISMLMVLLGVAIPVLALLYIRVLQDRRQIAILGSLGFSRTDVFGIYLLAAAMVGVVGSAVGVALGLGLAVLFEHNPIFDYGGFVIRRVLSIASVLTPAATLLATTIVAGLGPALMAVCANTATALKEE